MAIFKFKKEEEKAKTSTEKVEVELKKTVAKKVVKKTETFVGHKDIATALVRPRITEKATDQSEKGVYVFEVAPKATKENIKAAILHFYKVTPRKVNITKTPRRKVSSKVRGKFGMKPGIKKAYVYLKKGDTIEIV